MRQVLEQCCHHHPYVTEHSECFGEKKKGKKEKNLAKNPPPASAVPLVFVLLYIYQHFYVYPEVDGTCQRRIKQISLTFYL